MEGESLSYPTLEHTFQATKTLNLEERERIRLTSTPGEAKKMGRRVKLREDWESIKNLVMLDLLRLKFSDKLPYLKQKLIDTGDAHLIEGNTWHDNHFGVCTCIECGSVGKNILGRLLMKVRDEINSKRSEMKG
jgi:ribA/ribD-fused uncharacterized protein